MALIYTLHNLDVEEMATAVLVKNLLDSEPAKPCDSRPPESKPNAKAKKNTVDAPAEPPAPTPAPPAPTFVYCPWQLLNPSPGAEEAFDHNGILSVVVKKTAGTDTIQSKRVPVQVGSSYTLAIGESDIQVQALPPNGKAYVEIVTPTPSVDPFTVNIEWYLSGHDISQGQCIGISQDIGPDTSAFLQPDDGTLLFLAVAAEAKTDTFSPADIGQATAYQPPRDAVEIEVAFESDESGQPAYRFSRKNAYRPD